MASEIHSRPGALEAFSKGRMRSVWVPFSANATDDSVINRTTTMNRRVFKTVQIIAALVRAGAQEYCGIW
jgi:hypothetical protein